MLVPGPQVKWRRLVEMMSTTFKYNTSLIKHKTVLKENLMSSNMLFLYVCSLYEQNRTPRLGKVTDTHKNLMDACDVLPYVYELSWSNNGSPDALMLRTYLPSCKIYRYCPQLGSQCKNDGWNFILVWDDNITRIYAHTTGVTYKTFHAVVLISNCIQVFVHHNLPRQFK